MLPGLSSKLGLHHDSKQVTAASQAPEKILVDFARRFHYTGRSVLIHHDDPHGDDGVDRISPEPEEPANASPEGGSNLSSPSSGTISYIQQAWDMSYQTNFVARSSGNGQSGRPGRLNSVAHGRSSLHSYQKLLSVHIHFPHLGEINDNSGTADS